MKKLRWYQYVAILISVWGVANVIIGIRGGNGGLIFVGIAMIIGAIQLFRSKESKPKSKDTISKDHTTK